MLAKRIIPCLDVRNGKVVKGVNFEGIKDVGDPVLYAEEYNKQGADEIVFYDITASFEGRGVFLDVVRETAKKVFVPLTVGGGIKTVDDIREALRAGADKVSVNSQAVQNPQLIKDGADIFGSQCICVGIDAKRISDKKWTVFINGGRVDMKLDLIDWVKQIEQLGAGEICLNSIDADGTKAGFDIPMLDAVCSAVNIPGDSKRRRREKLMIFQRCLKKPVLLLHLPLHFSILRNSLLARLRIIAEAKELL